MNRLIRTRPERRRRWARGTAGVAAVAALSLVAAGCGSGGGGGGGGSTTGVTDDKIVLGTTQPLTGPAAAAYSKISRSLKAYFDHVNDNGGVNGRKIELVVEDDGYNPTNTANKTRKLVLEDKVFALVGALGTPTHTAVLDFIRQNKIPDMNVSSGSVSWNQPDKYPYTFGWQINYVKEGKILAAYAKEKFPGKKMCAFGQGDDFGKDGVKGVKAVLGDDGLAAEESYTATNTNVAPQIGSLQAAGCEVIFGFSITGFTALAMGTAAQLGYQPQWVVSSSGADAHTLGAYLKKAAPLAEGLVGVSYLVASGDDSNSWVKMFKGIHEEYNTEDPWDGTTLYGLASAYTMVQALKAAGEDLTRESFIEAVEKGGFTGPGLVPLAWSEGDHNGYTGGAITVIKGGENVIDSPVYVTDDGDGPVEEHTGTPPEAPADGLPQ
jgi:branched-chain amino acid transport system substrate-binding protein